VNIQALGRGIKRGQNSLWVGEKGGTGVCAQGRKVQQTSPAQRPRQGKKNKKYYQDSYQEKKSHGRLQGDGNGHRHIKQPVFGTRGVQRNNKRGCARIKTATRDVSPRKQLPFISK